MEESSEYESVITTIEKYAPLLHAKITSKVIDKRTALSYCKHKDFSEKYKFTQNLVDDTQNTDCKTPKSEVEILSPYRRKIQSLKKL